MVSKTEALAELKRRGVDVSRQEAMAELRRRGVDVSQQKTQRDEGGLLDKLGQAVDLGASFVQGRTFGVAPKYAGGIGALAAEGMEALGLKEPASLSENYKRAVEFYRQPVERAREQNPVLSGLAELAGGLRTGVGLSKTQTAQRLGNIARGAGLKGRAAVGAGAGELSQRVYEAGEAPVGEEMDILTSKTPSLGGILGGAFPVAGAGAGAVSQAIKPTLKDTAKEMVNLAKKFDIPLGIDDLTDNKFYQQVIQKGGQLPFSGRTASAEQQLKAFTRAVARTIGLDDVDNLKPSSMDKAFDDIGDEFDKIAQGKKFAITDDMLSELSTRASTATEAYSEDTAKKINKKALEFIDLVSKEDMVSGEKLNQYRSSLNKLARKAPDFERKSAYKDLENFVIDVMTEGNEEAKKALSNAKLKYKNLIAIEPLAQKVQEEGVISPALLMNRVRAVYGRDFTRGRAGDLGQLALLGQAIKQKVPDSGTPIGNVILGAMTGGNIPLAFISPAAAGAQAGLTGLGMLGNRALQARNVNPQRITDLIRQTGVKQLPSDIKRGSQLGVLSEMLN